MKNDFSKWFYCNGRLVQVEKYDLPSKKIWLDALKGWHDRVKKDTTQKIKAQIHTQKKKDSVKKRTIWYVRTRKCHTKEKKMEIENALSRLSAWRCSQKRNRTTKRLILDDWGFKDALKMVRNRAIKHLIWDGWGLKGTLKNIQLVNY